MRRLLKVGLAVGVVLALITLFGFPPREDHRTTYDKEGRNLPAMSLKFLATAMHEYNDKRGRMPPAAVCSKEGEPLLSWRVLLLPYLEHDELFRQFHLDEPWDSPHNFLLLPKMPQIYSPLPGSPTLEPYTTLFQVFTGNGTAFDGHKGLRLKEDFRRTSYTVLIVEAGKSVPWTKPEDIPYDENQPLPKLGGFFKGWFHVVMADGYAFGVRQGTNQANFRGAILRNADGPWPWD